ncbi:MAG: tyrosine-type recombinase/integrase, partial [Marmoricola sp.]
MAVRRTKRSDGRFTVTVTYEDEHGIKRRHFCYGKTQTEAKAKAEEARRRMKAGSPVRDASRTLADWLAEWRMTFLKASDRADTTKTLYQGLTHKHVEPLIGGIRLDRLKPADVTRLLLSMESAGKAASTRRNAYAALRGALDDAVANGLLAANPVEKVKRPKADHTEALSLDPEQVRRFLIGAEGLRYVPALRLILGTGLRRGEALAIGWADVDLTRQELRINGSLGRRSGVLTVAEPKTVRSRRVISLSPAMVALLKAQKAAQAAERLTAGNLWKQTGYVFATEFGEPADPRNLLRAVQIASGKADLPVIGVHTLRHTYATTGLLNGVPLHVMSRTLGHSTI